MVVRDTLVEQLDILWGDQCSPLFLLGRIGCQVASDSLDFGEESLLIFNYRLFSEFDMGCENFSETFALGFGGTEH